MSTSIRIFLAIFVTVGIGFFLLYTVISDDLKPQFRASTEEPLVDTSWLLANLASAHLHNGKIDIAVFREAIGQSSREIPPSSIYGFTKTSMDLRIYITDAKGMVVFDSAGRDEGADYSRWNDVMLTLQGRYGTRTSSDPATNPPASTMYVAAPIKAGKEIVGVVSVGKPTRNVNAFIDKSRGKLLTVGLITFAAVIAATLLISTMVTRPIARLTAFARSVSRGERRPMPKISGGEAGQLSRAFAEMLTALEGKQYMENYIQTLTHEMKSPISAIQGAVELLREEMPADRRERFLNNIEIEGKRMQRLIDRLLLLSAIEARQELRRVEEIDLKRLTGRTAATLAPTCMTKNVAIKIAGEQWKAVRGEADLLEQAVMNLLQNALDFSPTDGIITVTVGHDERGILLTIDDQGPGIPDYALPRVFDRFYSLNRPDSGKKSSGLGLSLVQEAMLLHGGSVTLENLPERGARAILHFPG